MCIVIVKAAHLLFLSICRQNVALEDAWRILSVNKQGKNITPTWLGFTKTIQWLNSKFFITLSIDGVVTQSNKRRSSCVCFFPPNEQRSKIVCISCKIYTKQDYVVLWYPILAWNMGKSKVTKAWLFLLRYIVFQLCSYG